MCRYQAISLILIAFLFAMSFTAQASSVHKWIDENGVTHYSDQAPEGHTAQVNLIQVTSRYRKSDVDDDYYSVSNQWARMHSERLERKKLQLEKTKLKQSQTAAAPQVVYIDQQQEQHRDVYYPAYSPRFARYGYAHGRTQFRNRFNKRTARSNCRLPSNRYSRSGLTLTIR